MPKRVCTPAQLWDVYEKKYPDISPDYLVKFLFGDDSFAHLIRTEDNDDEWLPTVDMFIGMFIACMVRTIPFPQVSC